MSGLPTSRLDVRQRLRADYADSLRQIEESRRLIEQSQTLLASGAVQIGCIEDARAFCRRFFTWYNQDHHHVGIGLMTPDQVHYGQANVVHAARQNVLTLAYQANPERFVSSAPKPPAKPTATWINPPPPIPRLLIAAIGAPAEPAPQKSDPLPAVSPGAAATETEKQGTSGIGGHLTGIK